MTQSMLVWLPLLCATVASAADDPVARLRSARSLHCTYTSSVTTAVRNGQHIVERHYDQGATTFEDIDLAKGTARIVTREFGGGTGTVKVRWDHSGSLWLVEQSLSGNLISTTVFPVYAQGTHEFVVLESRHSTAGTTATGVSGLEETQYGTCRPPE
jgi:hypothetical protein